MSKENRTLVDKKQHLLIVDKLPVSLPKKRRGIVWNVLGLGLTREELESGLSYPIRNRKDVRVVHCQRWAKRAAEQVKKFIVPILDHLPRRQISKNKTLGSLLAEKNDQNLWWFLAISEKSPIRCHLIQELYYLALIRGATRDKKYSKVIWLAKNNLLARTYCKRAPNLAKLIISQFSNSLTFFQELFYWIRAVRAAMQVVSINIIAGVLGWKDFMEKGATVIFTVFPFWWINSHSPSATDRFFPKKPKGFFRRSTIYIAWWSASLKKTWLWIKVWDDVIPKHKITILQQHVTLQAIRRLFSITTFKKLVKFRKKVGQLKLPRFLGFKINRLLENEISRSIAAGDTIICQLVYAATHNIASKTLPAELVFRFEGQPIDRALINAARGICPSVGFWHSPFAIGPNYLPLLDHKKPCQLRNKKGLVKPMPEEMMTVKGICKKSLLQNGFPKNKIRTCSSLRSDKVIKILSRKKISAEWNKKRKSKTEEPKIFLACSADPKENTGLIYTFQKALENLPNLSLTLRPHPACRLTKDLCKLLKNHPKISTFRLAADSFFHSEICRSEVVVTGGSTLAFEAIALGVMPVVYESPAAFSACSMEYFAKSLIIVQSAEEMTQGILSCFQQKKMYLTRIQTWPRLCGELSITNKSVSQRLSVKH